MVELYTYAKAPVPGLVRGIGKDPRMAAAYVAGLPGVGKAVHEKAAAGATAAKAVLYHRDAVKQGRTHSPRIELEKGDRTDWHINMYVTIDESETTRDAMRAAWSIEYGRNGYVDSVGRSQPATQGIGALTTALATMWAG